MRTIIISLISLFTITTLNAQSLSNSVWTYTQRLYGNEKTPTVTSYFIFTSQTEVIWLFETPRKYLFPVGIGVYDAKKHSIIFSHTNPLHKRISLYYRNNTIKFEFIICSENTATIKLYDDNNLLKDFYNDGAICNLLKEKYTIQPNPQFVGTSWKCNIDGEKGFIYFKSKYDVLIGGESHLYVSIGNNVFIKAGDNLSDENFAGHATGNQIFLYQDGLDVLGNEERYKTQIILKRIE